MTNNCRLLDLKIERDDFITSDKIFYYIQSLNRNDTKYIKTDFIINKNNCNPIATIHGWRNIHEQINISNISFLITGHADYEINDAYKDFLNNEKLKYWLCQNKNTQHPKLFSVPIGITNYGEPNSHIHKIIGNTDRIYKISKTPKNIKNLVYLNICANTYPIERNTVINLYKNYPWVSYDNPEKTEGGHQHFLEQIYSHKFVFAPRGNGIDTHRMWEALYLRSIPIVKKCIGMEDFYDLPILFVDCWENITEEFLNEKYEEMMSKTYNMEKIKINYWYNFIDQCVSKL